MPPSDISTGELARSVATVLQRMENIAARLESGQFVRSDLFDLRSAGLDASIKMLEQGKAGLDAHNELKTRVQKLEDANTWLVRLVGAFIVLGILGAVISFTGGAPR